MALGPPRGGRAGPAGRISRGGRAEPGGRVARAWRGGLVAVAVLVPALSGAAPADAAPADMMRVMATKMPDPGAHLAAEILARGIRSDVGPDALPDPSAAFRDYALAAALGDADAELNLGVMEDSGVGVPVDRHAAAIWYARAAARGQARAAYDLALLYEEGDGVPRSPGLANAWFAAAKAGGIRAARDRHLATGPEAAPVVPVLLSPEQEAIAGDTVVLVWQPGARVGAPDGSPDGGEHYWVEVVRAEDPRVPVVWSGTDRSALLVRLPRTRERYAWRVLAASAGTGHYAASRWRMFSTDSLDGRWDAGG